MAEQERPTKAYYVEETWSLVKHLLVFADNAEEAKRKVRKPALAENGDVEGLDTKDARPKGIRAMRAPGEDRRA